MFRNFLKIALRNLYRNKLFVLINTLGIGIALACCIIAYLNYSFDLSFDTFHEEAEQIYRVNVFKESNGKLYGITPLPLAERIEEDIPWVEAAVRLYYQSSTVKKEDQVFNEKLLFADPDFLDLFTFPVLEGTGAALENRSMILITEAMAEKYFGESEALGQPLIIYAGEDHQLQLTVGGILQDPPLNGSIQFDFLIHMENLMLEGKPAAGYQWERFADLTFLKLANPEQVSQTGKALDQYTAVHNSVRKDWEITGFFLQPFTEAAHTARAGDIRADYLFGSLPESAVWGPIVMAILLFITACLNLTNTTVSLSDQRLKEMGVRRVMGGTQKQLIVQLLSESFLLTLLGLIAAILLADLLIPAYNQMWPFLEIKANYLSDWPLLIFLLVTFLLTGLLSGAYPAFYISSFSPVKIFRGRVKFGGSNLFTRILLGVQVMISLVAVIGGIGFARNAAYQKQADLGYDRSGIVGIYVADEASFNTLKDVAVQEPAITELAGTHHHVGYSMRRQEFESQGESYESLRMDVGAEYLDLIDVKISRGRAFDPQLETEDNAAIVNQTLVDEFGWEDPINRQFVLDSVTYTIVGVVGDFVQSDFFSPIQPMVMTHSDPEEYRYLIARTDEAELVTVFTSLKDRWSELFPFRPYQGFYQDELLAEELLISSNIKWMFLFLAIVSILMTATGLFALVSLNILKRMKEIAIRRIVGASVKDIVFLVNKNYFWIFVLAVAAGSYGGSFLTQMILSSIFAIHVPASILMLVLASLSVLLIAAVTISIKILEVIRVNPAEILSRE